MTPNISALVSDIASAQASLARLNALKRQTSAIYASALAQRPAGIPATWLPDFTNSAGSAHVWAWFDPDMYGSQLLKG